MIDQLHEAARRGVMKDMTDSFPGKVIPVKTVADVRAAVARQTELQGGDHALSSSQQRIVDAAALLESLGFRQPDVVRLALFAGQSATGGYWRQNIGRCRSLGLIEGTALTDAGRARARPSAIQTTEDLQRHVFENLLSGAQRPILKVLVDAYPDALSPAETGRRANLEPEGGYWRQNIGRLRSLGLVTKKGPLAALPVLFADPA